MVFFAGVDVAVFIAVLRRPVAYAVYHSGEIAAGLVSDIAV